MPQTRSASPASSPKTPEARSLAVDSAPAVTRAIAALTSLPPGTVEVGAFAHPTRPEVAGKLVRYLATGRFAIVSGNTVTGVPQDWARAQEEVSRG